jgi:hypothetical protein
MVLCTALNAGGFHEQQLALTQVPIHAVVVDPDNAKLYEMGCRT